MLENLFCALGVFLGSFVAPFASAESSWIEQTFASEMIVHYGLDFTKSYYEANATQRDYGKSDRIYTHQLGIQGAFNLGQNYSIFGGTNLYRGDLTSRIGEWNESGIHSILMGMRSKYRLLDWIWTPAVELRFSPEGKNIHTLESTEIRLGTRAEKKLSEKFHLIGNAQIRRSAIANQLEIGPGFIFGNLDAPGKAQLQVAFPSKFRLSGAPTSHSFHPNSIQQGNLFNFKVSTKWQTTMDSILEIHASLPFGGRESARTFETGVRWIISLGKDHESNLGNSKLFGPKVIKAKVTHYDEKYYILKIDQGSSNGIELEKTVRIRNPMGLTVAIGKVIQTKENESLVEIEEFIEQVSPEPGDTVE